jgi:hypothetical protein
LYKHVSNLPYISSYSKAKITEPKLGKPTATVTPKPDSPGSSPAKSSVEEDPEEVELGTRPKDKSVKVNVCEIRAWMRVNLEILKVIDLP